MLLSPGVIIYHFNNITTVSGSGSSSGSDAESDPTSSDGVLSFKNYQVLVLCHG